MTSLWKQARSVFHAYVSPPAVSTEDVAKAEELVRQAISAHRILFASKSYCPYCHQAKKLLRDELDREDAAVLELDQRDDGKNIQAAIAVILSKSKVTVPQVWIRGQHVGGCDDLFEAHKNGRLAELLAK